MYGNFYQSNWKWEYVFALTSPFSQASRLSSSSNSPIPSKQALTIISVHPDTFLTMFGLDSDRLIMNSSALRRRAERSSRSSNESCNGVEAGGGKMNDPCRLPALGKGRPTVGVGPQSTEGRMMGGRKESRFCKWGAKRVGCVVHSGVRSDRKVDK